MKVMHVLNSSNYSGAEKVVCQIIKSFREDGVEMVYCSPDGEIVRKMLAEQGVTFLPLKSMSVKNLRQVIQEQKPDLIHAHVGGDGHHGDAVQIGCRDTGHEVGGAGAAGSEAYTGFTCGTGETVGSMGSALFVGG